METLPIQMVQKVCKLLTPQDLAHCCAVSLEWRDIFNQDCLWMPHCDPKLEETLRTTPSIVKPVFISPEVENSTLERIGKWRLAFMREKHLWGNWKYEKFETNFFALKHDTYARSKTVKHAYKPALSLFHNSSFLSSTLLVNLCTRSIKIWDVSVDPATLLMETDLTDIQGWVAFNVVSSNMVIVHKITSIQIYFVDVMNKSITMKHEIPLEGYSIHPKKIHQISIDGTVGLCYVAKCFDDTKMFIINVDTGIKIIEQSCPVLGKDFENARIEEIKTDPTSDNVLVAVVNENDNLHCCIYNIGNKMFLPAPSANFPKSNYFNTCAIIKNYIAFGALPAMTIIDCNTMKVLFKNEDQKEDIKPLAHNDSFICLDVKINGRHLKIFSLTKSTPAKHCAHKPYSRVNFGSNDHLGINDLKIINYKLQRVSFEDGCTGFGFNHYSDYLSLMGPSQSEYVSVRFEEVVNKAFTRGFCKDGFDLLIYYHW